MATLHLPRLHEVEHPRLRAFGAIFWSVAGGLVLLFLFFTVLGAIEPGEVLAVTIGFALLGVLWLVHAWPSLRSGAGGGGPRGERERRGF